MTNKELGEEDTQIIEENFKKENFKKEMEATSILSGSDSIKLKLFYS